MRKTIALAAACAAFAGTSAHATESGGNVYPLGAEGTLAGALPPPGVYYLGYVQSYSADRFNDGDGKQGFIPAFDVDAQAAVSRVVWVTGRKVLGADLAMHVVAPVVRLDAHIAGVSDRRTGVTDVTVDPLILGWHFTNGLHVLTGVDINVPVGNYSRTSVANISRHHWNVEPVVAVAYYPKNGLQFDLKAMYDINFKNRDAQINALNPTGADYRSGNELHVDFAATKPVHPKVSVGVGGYYYRQTTSDQVDDPAAQATIDTLGGFKGEVFAAGPTVRVAAGKAQVIATWQHEFTARYRPQGEKLWIKMILPLASFSRK